MATETLAFGTLLRRYRRGAGLSQEALAERAGISATAVAALERGRRTRPRADTVALLAEALGLQGDERQLLIDMGAGETEASTAAPQVSFVSPDSSGGSPSLFGRDEECANVLDLLTRHRLVTLIGPGGIGKTSMAQAILRSMREREGLETWFVDLASTHDSRLLATVIAAALGVTEDPHDGLGSVVQRLKRGPAIIVLDNFEQIVEGGGVVLPRLLNECAELRILVTSRIPLRIRGERRYSVAPLATPRANEKLDSIQSSPSVRLFTNRAEAVQAGLCEDADTMSAIAEICRRLDGLPLAIELAAARAKLLPPATLLTRLDHRLAVLKGGPNDLPDRHRSLRATLDWSHDLLSRDEQQVFARLSVFEGGATLDAIEALCSDVEDDLLACLERLLEECLAVRVDDGGGEARFGMLQTIQEYAHERLRESGVKHEIRRRHADYYARLSEASEGELVGGRQAARMHHVMVEMDNIRAALAWSLENRQRDLALRLGIGMRRYWVMSAHMAEGREWLERIMASFGPPGIQGDDGGLAPRDPQWGNLLFAGSALAFQQTDYERAKDLAARALETAGHLGDLAGIADALNVLASSLRNQGDVDQAIAYYESCLRIFRMLEDRRGVAVVLNNLGTAAGLKGDLEEATRLHEEGLVLRRQLGDQWGVANVLSNIADLARFKGEFVEAEAFARESLSLREELNDRNGMALAMSCLGEIVLADGDERAAVEYFSGSLRWSLEVGNRGLTRSNVEGVARAAVTCGRLEEGVRLLGAVDAMVEDLGFSTAEEFHEAVEGARGSLRAEGDSSHTLFETEWKLGHSFTFDRTVDEALRLAEELKTTEAGAPPQGARSVRQARRGRLRIVS